MSGIAERILALHGWVALAVVFLLPALESSAFVGFVFPGEIAVILGGVLAFQHRVSLPAVMAAAIAGAVVGDSIGYEVGKRYGRRILHGTIGRVVRQEHLDRAEAALARNGGKAVFAGRFTAALRVLIPGLAGMAGIPYRTFAVYNVAGGAIWAGGFVVLGYLAGSSYHRVESVARQAGLLLLLLAVVLVVVIVAARAVARRRDLVLRLAARLLDRPPIAAFRRRYHRQIAFLARRFQPGGAFGLELTLSLVVLAVLGWLFGVLVLDVLRRAPSIGVDQPLLDFVVRHREARLTGVMRVVTRLGSSVVLVPVLVVAGARWWHTRRSVRPLVVLLCAWGGSLAVSTLVKALVDRPRPPASLRMVAVHGAAFPSGHAAEAVAVWGTLAALAAVGSSAWSRKVLVWAVAFTIGLVVGLSRLYLGVHWATDVAGGWTLGSLWLLALLSAARTTADVRDVRHGRNGGSDRRAG